MIPILIALLLLAAPPCSAAFAASPSVNLDAEAGKLIPDAQSISAAIADLAADGNLTVSITMREGVLTVETSFTPREGASKALTSTLPARAVGSLIPTIRGDAAYLRGASPGDLEAPPALLDSVSLDALARLTGWSAAELEPVGIAPAGRGIVVCFPRRYLSLGSGFAVTASTLADIIFQEKADPLIFSGIAADREGRVVLLSESGGKAVISRSLRGESRRIDAPEARGPLARISGDTLAAAGGSSALTLLSLNAAAPAQVRHPARLVSAMDSDAEGNLWLFDGEERRIRILSPAGAEIHSIKPIISPAVMPLPQSLAVFPDGSFLLGGSAEVWKFTNAGAPVWRLARIPGPRRETLPSVFSLAVDGEDGSIYLLDPQSRRILRFAGNGGRSAESGVLARADSMDAEALERALAREKALRASELVDSLTADMSFDRADAACAAAVEYARRYRVKQAADAAASGLHEALLARKSRLAKAVGEKETPLIAVREPVQAPRAYPACAAPIVLTISARNPLAESMENVRVTIGIPGKALYPEMALFSSLKPKEERTLSVSVTLSSAEAGATDSLCGVSASVLAEFTRGGREKSAFMRVEIAGSPPAAAGGYTAAMLACAARPRDPLLSRFASGSGADALSILGSLGVLRGRAAGMEAGSPPAAAGAPDARAALRGLSESPEAWTVLAASLAANRGLESGVAMAGGSAIALIRTAVPLEAWKTAFTEKPRLWDALVMISREGKITIPLSGNPAYAGDAPGNLAESVLAALEALSAAPGSGAQSIVWLDAKEFPSAEASPAPVFPAAFPVTYASVGIPALAAEIRDAQSRVLDPPAHL